MPRRKPVQQPVSTPSVLEPLLSVEDVKSILGLSKPKVYNLMHTKGLPSFKIDGARRFERASLLAWIEQQKAAS